MARTIKIAAIQLDATPAPVPDRLSRAANLVTEAVAAGAQLVVLPEVFNTGYEYSDANYALAETTNGQTVTWMKAQAAQQGIHLAGSLLLMDEDNVYNSMLLVAPDGRTWRYDKSFPWAWERAYFREGRTITVADTDLGRFGMLICWDYAHPELWARYAGKVDAILIASCPPKTAELDIVFPDGTRYNNSEGPTVFTGTDMPFGMDLQEQSTWLRVPVVNTTGSGTFRSKPPMALISLSSILAAQPGLWKQLLYANEIYLECGFYPQTKIADAQGNLLAQVAEEGDRCVVAEVELADLPPKPLEPQPKSVYTPYAYLMSDWVGPAFMTLLYRRGYRRQFGRQMAPVDYTTRVWSVAAILALLFGWVLGFAIGKGKQNK
jgi:predicted amidohydrolase